jgi:GMP synthase-like glutamine amidotransferase
MARALVLVHSPVPEPGGRHVGTIAPALRELDYDVTIGTLIEDGDPVPEPDQLDALVIMGSAASADDDSVSWLARELAFVRRAVAVGTPVLGVCFGGQVLARVLGGTVGRAPRPERGLVTLDSADPAVLPSGTWMEFHYDAFTLPPGTVEVARNDVGVQAFTFGPHLGVQFHPEMTPDVWAAWNLKANIDLVALNAEVDARADTLAAGCRELVARFHARSVANAPAVRLPT